VEIQSPLSFWLLVLLIPVGVLFFFDYIRSRRALKKLGGPWRFDSFSNVFLLKKFFGDLFFYLFLVFTVLALVDLRWGESLVEDDRMGFEVVFAVDVSRSMLARDVRPSRLGRTVEEIKRFVRESRVSRKGSSRFGIVVFKGEAECVLPVTEDEYAVDLILSSLSPALLTTTGTNLERAIRKSLDTFQTAGRYQFILLFSDGESLSGDPAAAAKKAADRGIPVIPVAVGTEEGAEIILNDGTRILDDDNLPVISRLNRRALKEIASLSRSRFYAIDQVPMMGGQLLNILKGLDSEDVQQGLRLVKKRKYRIFLFLGIFSLTLLVLIRSTRWKNTF
jgi:Ca-activated chloride channel family protein